jgi:drug/metabolite transporter (DMT)-like permease
MSHAGVAAGYHPSMRTWPPLLWPAMSIASLLVLMGLGPWNPTTLILGVVLILAVFAASAYSALSGGRRPVPDGFKWIMAVLALFYVVVAVAAAFAGTRYVPAALLASLIPFSAAFLLLAMTRQKSHTASSVSNRDGTPGIGMDDGTPLGDTPEHSDAERVARPDRRFKRRDRNPLHR